jgi:uncharacterized protein YfaS (alpha-2-macroglobulin family)
MNLLPFLLLTAAFAAAETPPLAVLAVTPAGVSQGARVVEEIVVTFNQPMTALASPADMGRNCPVKISPEVPGRCRWRGTQVLAFEPAEPLSKATSFHAEIPAGVKSVVSGRTLEKTFGWGFETVRPALVDSRPRNDDRWIGLNGDLFLHFDAPVDPVAARDFTALREDYSAIGTTRDVAVGVRRATPQEIKSVWPYHWGENAPSTWTVLALHPAEALRPDRSYGLVVKAGLRGMEGRLGTAVERVVRFHTVNSFRAFSGPTTQCAPRTYELTFSNPVKLGDLMAATRIEGSTLPWSGDEQRSEYTGRRVGDAMVLHLPDPGLPPQGHFAVIVSSALVDAFGQKLGVPARFAFTNLGYCPQLKMNEGFGVLEQGLPLRQPVVAVNVSSAPLRKAVIADDAFIPFYRGFRWGCGLPSDVPGPVVSWNLNMPLDRRLRTFIDLAPIFASTSPARSGGIAAVSLVGLDGCEHKAVLDATRVGLHLKSSPDSTLVWATYLRTGNPAAGIPVELRGDDNAVLWKGITNASGLADAPGWLGLGINNWRRWSHPNIWAFAKDRQGTAVLSLDWRSGIEPWRFDISSDWAPRPVNYRAMLFTERGIYRAGETVHVKGLVRKLSGGDWKLLGAGDPRTLTATVRDSRRAEVLKTTVTLSAFSSFDLSIPLREGAPTGHWTLDVRDQPEKSQAVVAAVAADEGEGEGAYYPPSDGDGVSAGISFRVEQFKPAAFEVKAVPSTTSWMAGDAYQAGIEGWWLFGAPMAGEPASWTLRLEPSSYAPPGWPEFSFSPAWRRRSAETGRLLASGDATLDGQGRAAATAVLDAGSAQGPLSAAFEASVVSPDRQRLFARASSIVHRSSVYFGVKAPENFIEVGQKWSAAVVAVRPDGSRASTLGATWSLRRHEWLSIQRAGIAGRLEWVSEERDTVVSTGAFAPSQSTWTWTTTPDAPGYYEFSVAGVDEKGRPAETSRNFDVAGSGSAWWKRTDNDLIELVADKDSYKPGETARLLVKSPFTEATALITVEREGVIARWTQTLRGGAPLVRVPLDDRAVPNVFVSVVLVRGRSGKQEYDADGLDLAKPQAKFAYKALNVETGGRRLRVAVSSDKTEYRPGGKFTASVVVTDDAGKPAAAEVALFAVDEGVLNLTAYATPNPFDAFYGPRPLLVSSADSRPFVIGQRSFGEKGKNRGGGGGRGSPMAGVDLRSNFEPTAYWGPSLKVGADGKASASFNLPDSLTRFRLMAVAHEARKFGSGESRAVVSKPLSLRPSLPRLARVGDEFEGGVVVHNFSKVDSTVTVALALEGSAMTAEGELSRLLFVPAGKAVSTVWKCRATALGTAQFKFAARAGAETDGLLWKVPVRQREHLERVATSGVSDGSTIEAVAAPAGGVGAFEIAFSPSALSGLREGARFLLEYPYGCLEQRLSRALPVIVGADLVHEFGLGELSALKLAAQKEIDGMPNFQCPDGGYYYWTGCQRSDPWLTAYALQAAALARREGYHVPEDSVAKAARWLKAYLDGDRREWALPYSIHDDYGGRAFAVYALGLNAEPQPAFFRKLFDRRDQIPFQAKAYLLKAAAASGTPADAKILGDEMLSQARYAPRTIHFEDPNGDASPWTHSSNVRATAVALQALLEARGGFAGDEKAVRWLVEERKTSGRWDTTVDNADALRVLQDYYRRYEKETPAFTASVKAEDAAKALWTERFDGRAQSTRMRSFSGEDVMAGNAARKLAFIKEGVGRLYYDLVMAYSPTNVLKATDEGFEISRKVEPLKGDLRAGKRAVVTVTVKTKQDRTFVALEDPLPAGWEIVDTSFATEGEEQQRTPPSGGDEESWRGWNWGTFERAERYDDRIQVFADYMSVGEHRWTYLIQATTPGVFHQPATYVEAMYQPEVFGRSASDTVTVVR